MRILVGNHHLQKTGGTENYTYTLAVELKRLGHDVEYFTFYKGEISNKLEQKGIPYMSWQYYDLILANHTTVIEYLCRFGYIVQTCHGVLTELEQPSPFADRHVGISEEIKEYIKTKGYDAEIVLNGIDCERFAPKRQLSPNLKCVLSLSQSSELNEFIKDCCDELGIEFKSCNKFTDNVWEIEDKINEADLVVGIGRSLYDAMACGRCVLSYDNRGLIGKAIGDGYITKDNIEKSIYHNFIGRGTNKTFNREEFIYELKKYNPADGNWAREYALSYLNIQNAVKKYLSLYEDYPNDVANFWYHKMQKFYDMRCGKIETERIIEEKDRIIEEKGKIINDIQNSVEKYKQNLQRVSLKKKKYLKIIRMMGYSIILFVLMAVFMSVL